MSPSGDAQLQAVLSESASLRAIDRARMHVLPAKLVADLSAKIARYRLERGLSNEPASAVDLAMMVLSLEGIGQLVIDAHMEVADARQEVLEEDRSPDQRRDEGLRAQAG